MTCLGSRLPYSKLLDGLRLCDLRQLLVFFEDDKAKLLLSVEMFGFNQQFRKQCAIGFDCLAAK